MDPNEALKNAREYAARVLGADSLESDEAVALAESLQALDGWVQNGGFLPSDWAHARGDTMRSLSAVLIKPGAKAEYVTMRARLIEKLGYDAFRDLQEEAFFLVTKR